MVSVGVVVGVFVDVAVGLGVGVFDGEAVNVGVRVEEGVLVGVGVGVAMEAAELPQVQGPTSPVNPSLKP